MKRFLVVDDSPSVRRALVDALEGWGCTALEAADGAAALAIVHGEILDGIFLDLHMPNLGGASFMRGAASAIRKAPVVLVTGSDSSADITAALKLGASDVIAKPFDDAAVGAVLKRVFGLDTAGARRFGFDVLFVDPEESMTEQELATATPRLPATRITRRGELGDALRASPTIVVIVARGDARSSDELGRAVARQAPHAICLRLADAALDEGSPFHAACPDIPALRDALMSVKDGALVQLGVTARVGRHRGTAPRAGLYWLGLRSAIGRAVEARRESSATFAMAMELDLTQVPADPVALLATARHTLECADVARVEVRVLASEAHRRALAAANLERLLGAP